MSAGRLDHVARPRRAERLAVDDAAGGQSTPENNMGFEPSGSDGGLRERRSPAPMVPGLRSVDRSPVNAESTNVTRRS
jgi:hypothetical protein